MFSIHASTFTLKIYDLLQPSFFLFLNRNENSKHQKEGILAQNKSKTHKKLSVCFEWIHAFQPWQIDSQNNEFEGIISWPLSLFLEKHRKCEWCYDQRQIHSSISKIVDSGNMCDIFNKFENSLLKQWAMTIYDEK